MKIMSYILSEIMIIGREEYKTCRLETYKDPKFVGAAICLFSFSAGYHR